MTYIPQSEEKSSMEKSLERASFVDAPSSLPSNSLYLLVFEKCFEWFEAILEARLQSLSKPKNEEQTTVKTPLFLKDPTFKNTPIARLLNEKATSVFDHILLLTTLAPYLKPEFLNDRLIHDKNPLNLKHKLLGGYVERGTFHFNPTLQTALFLTDGFSAQSPHRHLVSNPNLSFLFNDQILALQPLSSSENKSNKRNHALSVASEYLNYFLTGEMPKPDFGSDFPARLINTNLKWEDLVLASTTLNEVNEAMHWLEYGDELRKLDSKINCSYPCLFYGPPGTGKTLTASLIGKKYQRPIFKIDLSMVVSKYIGETEKNLEKLFTRAEGKNWILFFDEADTLFSKRTGISNSNDKWANNEVAYLLQRVENYERLTILASNLKSNIDSAMLRRFQAIVHFPIPDMAEKQKLWNTCLPKGFTYTSDIKFDLLYKQHLSGANISNILKTACLEALSLKTKTISNHLILKSLSKELKKMERTLL